MNSWYNGPILAHSWAEVKELEHHPTLLQERSRYLTRVEHWAPLVTGQHVDATSRLWYDATSNQILEE
jgi:hypothetical protein